MKKSVEAETEYLLKKKIKENGKRHWKQEGRIFFDEYRRGGKYYTMLVREDDEKRCQKQHSKQRQLSIR